MRKAVIIGVVAIAVAGCSSSHPKSAASGTGVSFQSQADKDAQFVDTVAKSAYAAAFSSATKEQIVQAAKDLCQQATNPPANGVNELVTMTGSDFNAAKWFGHAAAAAYCPNADSDMSNLVGG